MLKIRGIRPLRHPCESREEYSCASGGHRDSTSLQGMSFNNIASGLSTCDPKSPKDEHASFTCGPKQRLSITLNKTLLRRRPISVAGSPIIRLLSARIAAQPGCPMTTCQDQDVSFSSITMCLFRKMPSIHIKGNGEQNRQPTLNAKQIDVGPFRPTEKIYFV